MKGAWGRLVVAVIVLALGVALWGRRPHAAPPAPPPPAPAAVDTLTLVVRDGAVTPASATFALGDRLALTIVNAGSAPSRIALAGYEHQRPEVEIRPGAVRRDTFALDLPGEDFTWRVDGVPVGRVAVKGSHLVEGHR